MTWIDVDQGPVINVRRKLVPARDGVTMAAANVVDPEWWTEVPRGRPTLIVGEGLLMYLPPVDVRRLIDEALAHPARDQTMVFDTVAPWVRRVSGWQHNFRDASTSFLSTTDDLDAAVRRHSEVRLCDEKSMVTLARESATGALAKFVGAVDAVGPGHRAMVLRTYAGPGVT